MLKKRGEREKGGGGFNFYLIDRIIFEFFLFKKKKMNVVINKIYQHIFFIIGWNFKLGWKARKRVKFEVWVNAERFVLTIHACKCVLMWPTLLIRAPFCSYSWASVFHKTGNKTREILRGGRLEKTAQRCVDFFLFFFSFFLVSHVCICNRSTLILIHNDLFFFPATSTVILSTIIKFCSLLKSVVL